jgi:glycosyltransferase involved in cell wall biosynthesis
MRTLFVTILSYPLRGGTHLRNWQNINIMKQMGSVGIFSVFNQDCQSEEKDGIELWYHYNLDKQSSFSQFVERGLRLISRFGLRYYWAYVNNAAQQLEQVLYTFKPDIVILEELGVYPYLSVVKKYPCRVIFDNHNVEGNLFKQIQCSGGDLRSWFKTKFHLSQIQSTEKTLAQKSDQIWVCSIDDKQLLKSLYGSIAPTYVVPNAIDISFYNDVRLGQFSLPESWENNPHYFLYLGNYFHPPNQEAAQLLIEKIYPRLREAFPNSRLLLVGSNPTEKMQDAAQKDPNIIVTGEVEDVRPYLGAASVMVVPLYKGGGTRFKILEAFAAGCPVVSTTKGAEGLNSEDGVHLLLRDDVEGLTEGIIKIWSDASLRERLVHNGYDLVQSNYSWDAVSHNVKLALEDLLNHPKSNM